MTTAKNNEALEGEVLDRDHALATQEEVTELENQLADIDPAELRRRVALVQEIKRIIVEHTQPTDWLIMKAKGAKAKVAYLGADGAERLAMLLGASWDEPKRVREQREGHYIWIFSGHFRFGKRKIFAIGSCTSRDRFFSRRGGERIPENEVNERDVQMKAFSNWIRNGISRALGLRNLDAAYFGKPFWGAIPVVEFDSGGRGGTSKSQDADEKKKAGEMWDALMEFAEHDEEKAKAMLKKLTTFKGKDGDTVAGVDNVDFLTGRRLQVNYEKVMKEKAKRDGAGGGPQ